MESTYAPESIDPEEPRDKPAPEPPPSTYWRRLLHRWFVEYNPLYLVSALLVLGGLTLISRSSAESSSVTREVVVPGISELYALALIAGAALLYRIRLRRPAVMLCLVTALYQGDLTLLTERQVYLGLEGALAVAVWLALFVAKIHALAWAMRLRLSRSAIAVPALGALGMALLPHALQQGGSSAKGEIVAVWVFTLFAAGLWTAREVTSRADLDGWGQTVLARTARAIWVLWAALASLHALFWCNQFGASTALLVPVALLLVTRFVKREAMVWITVSVTLLFAGASNPRSFWIVALLSAITLALRALRQPTTVEESGAAPSDATPYRASGADTPPPRRYRGFARADRASMLRLLTGSLTAVHLSLWTLGWHGGSLPAHAIWLDASLVAALALMAYRARTTLVLTPLLPGALHAGLQAGLISAPASALSWGITSVSTGFVLLLGSLAIAYHLRLRQPPAATPDDPAR